MESVLEDDAKFLELARKYNANIIFIDEVYEISVDLYGTNPGCRADTHI